MPNPRFLESMYILSVILECSILNCIFERRVLGYFGVSDGEQATKDESQFTDRLFREIITLDWFWRVHGVTKIRSTDKGLDNHYHEIFVLFSLICVSGAG